MANSPETPITNPPGESPFDRMAQNIWQVLYGLLGVGAALIITVITLWFTQGWRTFVLDLWLAGLGVVFLGSALAVYRWLYGANKELPAADLLRFLLLAIGGLGAQSPDFVERYWHETVEATGAKLVIPIHWDDFLRPVDAPQRPLSREHLLQATRIHEDVFDRSIDVQVLRLRRKLESDASTPSIIQTERGIGYVFSLPVDTL